MHEIKRRDQNKTSSGSKRRRQKERDPDVR